MTTKNHVHFVIDSFESEQCMCQRGGEGACLCGVDENGNSRCACGKSTVLYDTIFIDLPMYFCQSNNANKSLSITIARLFDISDTSNPREIISSMHSNIVRINESADNYCCSCNMIYPIPKDYPMPDNKSRFEVWFRDIYGNLIDLDTKKIRCIIEMTLHY